MTMISTSPSPLVWLVWLVWFTGALVGSSLVYACRRDLFRRALPARDGPAMRATCLVLVPLLWPVWALVVVAVVVALPFSALLERRRASRA